MDSAAVWTNCEDYLTSTIGKPLPKPPAYFNLGAITASATSVRFQGEGG